MLFQYFTLFFSRNTEMKKELLSSCSSARIQFLFHTLLRYFAVGFTYTFPYLLSPVSFSALLQNAALLNNFSHAGNDFFLKNQVTINI